MAEAVGTGWGDGITEERQAHLLELLAAWNAPNAEHGDRNGPFDLTGLSDREMYRQRLTGADVSWLAEQTRDNQGFVSGLHLEGHVSFAINLESASLPGVHLEGASLNAANLAGADLTSAHLERASLADAHMENVTLDSTYLEQANLSVAHLEGAEMTETRLERADLEFAWLNGAIVGRSHLEGSILRGAHLDDTDFTETHLDGADLRLASLNSNTNLTSVTISRDTYMGDIHWGGVGNVDLTQIAWKAVDRLGDETCLGANASAANYEAATRAYRQVAAQLRAQGLEEVSDRFLYRAQVLQRKRFHLEKRWPRWVFSWFLQGLAGYGFRPAFTLGWYLLVLVVSAAIFCWQGAIFAHVGTPGFTILGTSIVDAFTSIHGRGFFPSPAESGWQMGTAAFDAVAGLIIEASFIATFTQRFFAR